MNTQEHTSNRRASVLGCAREIDFTPEILAEMKATAQFLLDQGITEISTGAGGGVPRKFSSVFMDLGGKAHGFSPWNNLDEAAEADQGWVQDERMEIHWVGGGESGNFGMRDADTIKGCKIVISLPWGLSGAGTGREIMAALKKMHVEQILFLCSVLAGDYATQRTIKLYQAADAFKNDKTDKKVWLWWVELLHHYHL